MCRPVEEYTVKENSFLKAGRILVGHFTIRGYRGRNDGGRHIVFKCQIR